MLHFRQVQMLQRRQLTQAVWQGSQVAAPQVQVQMLQPPTADPGCLAGQSGRCTLRKVQMLQRRQLTQAVRAGQSGILHMYRSRCRNADS